MRGCGTGAEALFTSVRAHGTPLVVIALQPYLEKVLEPTVVGNVGRREMRVVVENRLRRGILVIQTFGRLGLQQEIIMDEFQRGLRSHVRQ